MNKPSAARFDSVIQSRHSFRALTDFMSGIYLGKPSMPDSNYF